MAKIIHSMIRVLDLDASVAFYGDTLGLDLKRKLEFEDFTLAYLRNDENDFELELTLNHGRTEPYTHGSGYGHIAVTVEDLGAEHARFKTAGYEPRDIVELKNGETTVGAFFFMTDPDGYEIEFIQRAGDYQ
jgi:lactoylglutathione lyase